jgi:pentatricopeptide repeat protein
MAASDGAKYWQGGEEVMKQIRESGCSLNEGIASAMVKLCSGAGDIERAHGIIKEMQSLEMVRKRRTYAPILAALALKEGKGVEERLEVTMGLMKDSATQSVDLMEEDFVNVVQVCTRPLIDGLWDL